MSQRPGFVFLRGIVGGLLLSAITLGVCDAVFHDAFEKAFCFWLPGIGTASSIGFVNLLFGSQENEVQSSESKGKDGFPSGGNDAL